VHVADLQQHQRQQHHQQPQHRHRMTGARHEGRQQTDHGRRRIPGEQRHHHPESGRPAPGDRQTGRVRMQPDPLQRTTGERRRDRVARLVAHRHQHPHRPPGQHHRCQRDQPDHDERRGVRDRSRRRHTAPQLLPHGHAASLPATPRRTPTLRRAPASSPSRPQQTSLSASLDPHVTPHPRARHT